MSDRRCRRRETPRHLPYQTVGGNLCPHADNRLSFDTQGAVAFRAVCNGDPTSLERFTEPTMKTFGGRLVVLVEALRSGMGTLHVSLDRFKTATVKFMVK
jgi:beta-galactosidase